MAEYSTLPSSLAVALEKLDEVWDDIGASPKRLNAFKRVLVPFLKAHASTWSARHVDDVATELRRYAVEISLGMHATDFNKGQTLVKLGTPAAQTHLPTLNHLFEEQNGPSSSSARRRGAAARGHRERDRSRSPPADDERDRRDRHLTPPRSSASAMPTQERSLAKSMTGPPHYKLQRLRPF